ncbi:hypothetical protein B0O99DRAFT_681999 [Bisporella sp. PMI_857]|nr:hypothetical protein B0O99DRAFT_682992 [Bisporella sp. PMI_857]KAH8600308.1 hypothetical protein B0O99DRAFT_681999 [Bisporella sp. PMI_857]
MPHRVSSFFKYHAYAYDLPTDIKKGRPALSERSLSSNNSIASVDDMPEQPHKRLSFPGKHSSPRSSTKSIPQIQPATLNVGIESPPLVFYGTAANSSGALLSGQLKVVINEDSITIDSFKMRMAMEVVRKKPFHGHCKECEKESTDLTNWNFSQGSLVLKRGQHNFPFSYLLPGTLPASMKGILSEIEYVLRATMTTTTGETLKLSHVLDVKRAIHPGESPRNSIRIFPPTNLTANCQLPAVIHPIGETNISMRIDGCVKKDSDNKTQTQWRLKRVTWRLDETQKMVSPACAKHAAKLGKDVEESKKSVSHQEVKTLGFAELKDGWKSDYSGPDGTIEFEFPFSIKTDHPICDLKTENGTEVSHILVVEMIVTEELAPISKPRQVTPTGSARVLRMHFNVVVTERAGLGISWDEEQPPLYENVPASPQHMDKAMYSTGLSFLTMRIFHLLTTAAETRPLNNDIRSCIL